MVPDRGVQRALLSAAPSFVISRLARHRAVAGFLTALALLACLNDRATGPDSARAPVHLALTAEIHARAADQVRIRIYYLRRAEGDASPTQVRLSDELYPLADQISVTFEIGSCLNDPARVFPGPSCQFFVEVTLLGGGRELDRQTPPPVTGGPGETVPLPEPVTLYEICCVEIPAPTESAALETGSTLQLAAMVKDGGGEVVEGRVVEWSSADPAVAKVDATTGVVTAVSAGQATITASTGGRSGSLVITVTPRRRIVFGAAEVSFSALRRGSLPDAQSVAITNGGGGTLDGLTVGAVSYEPASAGEWLSASIDGTAAPATLALRPSTTELPEGTFTAIVSVQAPGADNTPATVRVTIVVGRARPARIELLPAEMFLEVGQSAQLVATPRDAADEALSGRPLAFSASTGAVTVAAGGLVTAVEPGESTITVESEGVSAAVLIRVSAKPVLDLAGAGSGRGGISVDVGEVACSIAAGERSGACSATYSSGTVVRITATPDAQSVFSGWSGPCAVEAGPVCALTVRAAESVTATFTLKRYEVIATSSGSGSGLIVLDLPARADPAVSCEVSRGVLSDRCARGYDAGEVATLSARPAPGSSFDGWGGACTSSGTAERCTLPMNEAKQVVASFSSFQGLAVAGAGTGSGSVVSQSGLSPAIACRVVEGRATSTECFASYARGTVVTLTATSDENSDFAGFGGDCAGADACVLTIESGAEVTAAFSLRQRTLSVSGGGTGSGTVTSVGDVAPAIRCHVDDGGATGDGCSGSYAHGTQVTLSAEGDASSLFEGFEGACSGTGLCVVSMDDVRAVTARFALRTYEMRVKAGEGTGSGTIRTLGAEPAIECHLLDGVASGTCAQSYPHGTALRISATPDEGSELAAWDGGPCNGSPEAECAFSITGSTSPSVTFQREIRPLHVTVGGTGSGTVTASPPETACVFTGASEPSSCSLRYGFGTIVTLTARPASAASRFAGWGGACAETAGDSCTVTMSEARDVTATFALVQYRLRMVADGDGGGRVSSSLGDPPISCQIAQAEGSGTCEAMVDAGSEVRLDVDLADFSFVESWSAPCSETTETHCTVTMDGPHDVTVRIVKQRFALSITVSGAGTVNARSSDRFDSCSGDGRSKTCTFSYGAESLVRIEAIPTESSVFARWEDACAEFGSEPSCTIRVGDNRAVGASFVPKMYRLDIEGSGSGDGSVGSDGEVTPRIDCTIEGGSPTSGNCAASYSAGTVVSLRASSENSRFGGWGGDCEGTGECTIVMDADKLVEAVFVRRLAVVIAPVGDGSGEVTIADDRGTELPCTITLGTVTSGCTGEFDPGTTITLTATRDETTSAFRAFGAPPCPAYDGSNSPCTFTLEESQRVTAEFVLRPFTVRVYPGGTREGFVSSSPEGISCHILGGSIYSGVCQATYPFGTAVTLSASSDNSRFTGWSGACEGTDPCTVVTNADRDVVASFGVLELPFTLTKLGSGSGSVELGSTEKSVTCTFADGAPCATTFPYGTSVSVTARPGGSSEFERFTFTGADPGCETSSACSISMFAPVTATATFQLVPRTVTVLAGVGAGTGRMTVIGQDPSPIDCVVGPETASGTCAASFLQGTRVTLQAEPSATSTLARIDGCDAVSGSTCTINALSNDRAISAVFSLRPVTLTLQGTGAGQGSVLATSTGVPNTTCTISSSSQCDIPLLAGKSVRLTATASTGSAFTGFGGRCVGKNPCDISLLANESMTASFEPLTLTIAAGGVGFGTVTMFTGSAPAPVCSIGIGSSRGTCTVTLPAARTVTLLADADLGSEFGGFSAACEGSGQRCDLAVDAPRTVTATFHLSTTGSTLVIDGGGSGSGSITGPSISCHLLRGVQTGACAGMYPPGSFVTLSATPSLGSTFSGWGHPGCPFASATCTFEIQGATSVAPFFSSNSGCTINCGGGGGGGGGGVGGGGGGLGGVTDVPMSSQSAPVRPIPPYRRTPTPSELRIFNLGRILWWGGYGDQ